jgi:ACS family tartrate transporter-like MFS transporter
MKDATGSFAGGLLGLALLSLIAAVICAFFLHIPSADAPIPMPANVTK